jgi:hypothetical protein
MKLFVRLAILFAALLLVANMALAFCENPVCYEIIATDENGITSSDYYRVCLYDDGTGAACSDIVQLCYDLYLFGGGPGWFNTSGGPGFANGDPNYTSWIIRGEYQSGFVQPIGEGSSKGDLLTGEGVAYGIRFSLQGRKVPCNVDAIEPK